MFPVAHCSSVIMYTCSLRNINVNLDQASDGDEASVARLTHLENVIAIRVQLELAGLCKSRYASAFSSNTNTSKQKPWPIHTWNQKELFISAIIARMLFPFWVNES